MKRNFRIYTTDVVLIAFMLSVVMTIVAAIWFAKTTQSINENSLNQEEHRSWQPLPPHLNYFFHR
jgi:uncharacterized membrane protein YraQ (UPF0718 family)